MAIPPSYKYHKTVGNAHGKDAYLIDSTPTPNEVSSSTYTYPVNLNMKPLQRKLFGISKIKKDPGGNPVTLKARKKLLAQKFRKK